MMVACFGEWKWRRNAPMACVKYLRSLLCGVALFSLLGCSKRGEAEQALDEVATGAQAETAPSKDGVTVGESSLVRTPAAAKESLAPAETANTSSELRAPSAIDPRSRAIMSALERSPLDIQRLLSGIREKYELEKVDDPKLQLADLLKRYEAGDKSVLLDLGLFVAYGDASIIDPAQAKAFFEEAAVDGESRALAELGRLYLAGIGMDRDPGAAHDYFAEAMAAGDSDGAFLLGMGYRNALFGEAEEATGIDYLKTAASMGHVAAANTLFDLSKRAGRELSEGQAASERRAAILDQLNAYPEIKGWLQLGVEKGDLASMLNLAEYYKISNSIGMALPVLQTAAELGSFDALKDLMDLSARTFRDAEHREAFKALLQPHIESGGKAKGEAQFRMAMLEALGGPGGNEEVRSLLTEASSGRYYKAWVALAKIDEGVPPLKALIDSLKMSEDDAYVRWTHRKELEMPSVDPNGRVQEKQPDAVAPVLTKIEHPSYPSELLAEALSGTVLVEVVIDENGKAVHGSIVESTHPAFEAPALEAARKMEFTPARRGGKAVAIKVRLPIYFNPAQ